jgi:hypothetical protein
MIVLAAADGVSNAGIARALSISEDTLRTWRGWFAAGGPAALADRPWPGRPVVYGPDVHLRIFGHLVVLLGDQVSVDGPGEHRLQPGYETPSAGR